MEFSKLRCLPSWAPWFGLFSCEYRTRFPQLLSSVSAVHSGSCSLSRVWPSSGRKLRLLKVEGSQGPLQPRLWTPCPPPLGGVQTPPAFSPLLQGVHPALWLFPSSQLCFCLTSPQDAESTPAGGCWRSNPYAHMSLGDTFSPNFVVDVGRGICFAILVALYNFMQEFGVLKKAVPPFFHNIQNLEATKTPFSRWMDKRTVVHPDNSCYSAVQRNELPGHEKSWRNLQRRAPSEEPIWKGCVPYDSYYMTFWIRQN